MAPQAGVQVPKHAYVCAYVFIYPGRNVMHPLGDSGSGYPFWDYVGSRCCFWVVSNNVVDERGPLF